MTWTELCPNEVYPVSGTPTNDTRLNTFNWASVTVLRDSLSDTRSYVATMILIDGASDRLQSSDMCLAGVWGGLVITSGK